MKKPLIEIALGVAWLVGISAALRILDLAFGPAALATAMAGALAVDLAAGRAGVRWSEDPEAKDTALTLAQRAAIGAGITLAAGAVVVGASAALHWFHVDGLSATGVLIFALVRAVALGVRDELLYRGIPLLAAERAGVPPLVARGFAALAGAAPLVLVPGVTPAAVAMTIALGWLCGALWERDRGAWAAVGAHGAWVLVVGSVLHGGLIDADWTTGNLALGATAAGPPAWLATGVLIVAAIVVTRVVPARLFQAHDVAVDSER